MKKISIILFTCLFICNNSYADHKGWPHGKKWAYNCAKTTDCNIVIENILEQPKLFIGKSVINGGNKVKNIAEKGDPIKPIKMVGIWKENWKGSKIFVDEGEGYKCERGDERFLKWSEIFDNIIYAPAIDDGNEIFLNKKFEEEVAEGEKFFRPWRHSWRISCLIQSGKFENLKKSLVEGAQGKWFKVLQSDPFLYKSGKYTDFQAYGNSLNWFYPTIIPLLEAHILLQQKKIYSDEEFKIVHSWLKKRVWALEQGPMDGLVSSAWKWKHFFEPGNHETINKKVAYMLWGIADQNETYFTASLNGFEDFYNTMRKKNGTFKNEHKKGDGQNYGLQSGNFVGQNMIVMAIILEHQGIDVRKKYPKIEKFVKWASKNYKEADKLNFGGGNNNLRFLSDDPLKKNTLGWMYLWGKEYGTDYIKLDDYPHETRTMMTYGVYNSTEITVE